MTYNEYDGQKPYSAPKSVNWPTIWLAILTGIVFSTSWGLATQFKKLNRNLENQTAVLQQSADIQEKLFEQNTNALSDIVGSIKQSVTNEPPIIIGPGTDDSEPSAPPIIRNNPNAPKEL